MFLAIQCQVAGKPQQITAVAIVAILVCNGEQSHFLVTFESTKWSGQTVPKGRPFRQDLNSILL